MTTIIGIKQLHKNMGRIARRVGRGERVLVMKHANPLFVIAPYHAGAWLRPSGKRYSLSDLRTLQTKGGDKRISKRIDALVYGV